MYNLRFAPQALKDIGRLKKSEPKAFEKVKSLLEELQEHPCTGTGKPKPLSGNRAGQWSRRISSKHRLIYKVEDEEVIVLVLSAWGHYDDK